MKKALSLILALAVLVSVLALIPAASVAEPLPMYVYAANGKPVNVRSSPEKANNVIGKLAYGEEVQVEFINADGWAVILYRGSEAYVQARFLQDDPPGPKPTKSPEEDEEDEEVRVTGELQTEKALDPPFYITLVPARTSGWVNFYTEPDKAASRICTFDEGKELVAEYETAGWYRARDPKTDLVGYIGKQYAQKVDTPYVDTRETPLPEGEERLGSLDVNGEFSLTCRLAEGYHLQVVKAHGDRIVAAVLPQDDAKPCLYLSVAYDESYADVDRMNDMSDEDLAVLEATYREMNDVEISYRETGHGTRLMIARETGSETDFVDILAIYRGYFVEFNMTPNPKAAQQALTDEQVNMCIDFLTDVDFTPAQ